MPSEYQVEFFYRPCLANIEVEFIFYFANSLNLQNNDYIILCGVLFGSVRSEYIRLGSIVGLICNSE